MKLILFWLKVCSKEIILSTNMPPVRANSKFNKFSLIDIKNEILKNQDF